MAGPSKQSYDLGNFTKKGKNGPRFFYLCVGSKRKTMCNTLVWTPGMHLLIYVNNVIM